MLVSITNPKVISKKKKINANVPLLQNFPAALMSIEEVSEGANVIDPKQSTSSASDILMLDD